MTQVSTKFDGDSSSNTLSLILRIARNDGKCLIHLHAWLMHIFEMIRSALPFGQQWAALVS